MKHLTLNDRFYIYHRLKQGDSVRKIAKVLNFSHSTIYREVNRNTGKKGYRYKQANYFAIMRHTYKNKAVKITDEVIAKIIKLLKKKYSPEQISGRWKLLNELSISHQSIYRYLWSIEGQGMRTFLKHKGKHYRKKYGGKDYQGIIPQRVDIENRDKVVDRRERIGDWEADLVVGSQHKGHILTLVERKSRLLLALPLPNKRSGEVNKNLLRLLSKIKNKVCTITFDNGREFSEHYKIKKPLNCETYFSKPYSSWQRGTCENTNGLLRRYFPKSMRLDTIQEKEVLKAVEELNHRPRKCLGYYTPYEVFNNSIKDITYFLTSGAFMT